jgi:hypothetical protein
VRFAPAQMVVDVLTEERDGVQKEREGEEGRFARLVTSLVETLHIDLGDFNGRWSPRFTTIRVIHSHGLFFKARNRVGIRLSYLSARLHRPGGICSLESIRGLLIGL